MSEKNATYNYHPIQLRDVKVLELRISANPSCMTDEHSETSNGSGEFGFYHTHSEYNEEAKSFIVKVAAVMGREDDNEEPTTEFDLRAELLGVFEVDEEHFPVEHIAAFASKNAPLIMYPYLREQVYSLTTRAGFDSAVLPLFEVPPFRLVRES